MTTISWVKQKPWFTVIMGYGSTGLTLHVQSTSQYTAMDAARKMARAEHGVTDGEVDLMEVYAVFLGVQENLVQSDGPV